MSEGILIFAHNNSEVDYVEMAFISAKYASRNLNRPVSLVTDLGSRDWLYSKYPESESFFDRIILTDDLTSGQNQKRRYYDGALTHKVLEFKNLLRSFSYDLSPYEKTLVIDCDLLITNDRLAAIWGSNESFMISKDHFSIGSDFDSKEFHRISEYSIDFYWATAFYFAKNHETEIFFNLCKHIVENYEYYRFVYRIENTFLRNDYVFSIAIHILYGFSNQQRPVCLPSNIFFILDREDLYNVVDSKTMIFLVNKKNYLGEYTLAKTHDQNVHIMNKFAFNRNAKKLLEVL